MSENTIKKSLKNTFRVHVGSRKPMKKVCDENEERNNKKDTHIKIFLMEGSGL